MDGIAHVARFPCRRLQVGARGADSKDAGDIVELKLGDKVSLFTSPDDLDDVRERMERSTAASRGFGDLLFKSLEAFNVDVDSWLGPAKNLAAELIAGKAAELADSRKVPGRPEGLGLYQCDEHGPYSHVADANAISTDGEVLVLLHGFFSNAKGSFGGLWSPGGASTLETLLRNYESGIYCFDHRTLGESPLSNALALAHELPSNASIHLLGYSRGGLVGELLSHAEASDKKRLTDEIERLRAQQPDEAKRLKELIEVLADKKIRFPHFVRVASPVRGTWLASDRLDLWLSAFFSVAQIAVPEGVDVLSKHVFDVIATVIKKRLERKHFPGIEAMRPDGALMGLLNDAPPRLDQRLTIVGGDCVAEGVLQRLKLFLIDGFFGEQHDLVVPTASMFGGAARDQTRYFFHQASSASHFNYFKQPESLDRIATGLIGSKAQYETLQPKATNDSELTLVANRAPQGEAAITVVVPGFLGSMLVDQEDRVAWPDPSLPLSEDRFTSRMDDETLEAVGLLVDEPINVHGDLIEFLESRGNNVFSFPYDWRKSISDSAALLAKRIREIWPKEGRALRIIGHSSGGLVARLMLSRNDDLRKAFITDKRSRLLLVGCPNSGMFDVVRTLLGEHPVLRNCPGMSQAERLELASNAARFPGLLDLLPQNGKDWSAQSTWDEYAEKRGIKHQDRPTLDFDKLAESERVRKELRDLPLDLGDEQGVCVSGFVDKRSPDATIDERDDGGFVPVDGDGLVSHASSQYHNFTTYYVGVPHGNLLIDKDALRAYDDLLHRGKNRLLRVTSTGLNERRARSPLRGYGARQLSYRPTTAELYRAILGMDPPAEDIRPTLPPPIKVRVVHGGLRYAEFPVIGGHYLGDLFSGAESELDRLFGGRMRSALDLGVYPGAVETFEVFHRRQLETDRRSSSSIIVGLGRRGELSVGQLRKTVRRGMLGWFGTSVQSDEIEVGVESQGRKNGFSIVLLGSTSSGMSVGECARAILQGTQDAQRILQAQQSVDGGTTRSIDTIELVEIFEDKALELASAIEVLLRSGDFDNMFRSSSPLFASHGNGLRRLRDTSRPITVVRRLDVRARKSGRLDFALQGIQAAVPLLRRDIDIEEVRAYARSVDERNETDRSLGRVLFNQLLPLDLKQFALEQYDLLLSLDKNASSIPWELADAGAEKPLAVQSGMIRQLGSASYAMRERVARDSALVIGDPKSDLKELPGALAEADAVAQLLRSANFEVTYLPRPTHLQVRDALSRRPYRIIHFAGHGVVGYKSPTATPNVRERTGMVIGSVPIKDPLSNSEQQFHHILLTPHDIRECVAQVPELVFINCCSQGRQQGLAQDDPKLASNLANSFMDIGCRAVIAAGWEVDDRAAKTFAIEFYNKLVADGAPYIDAVREARRAVYNDHDQSATWGAYQCYGDPRYSAVYRDSEKYKPNFVDKRELEYWLKTRPIKAMGADESTIEEMKVEIDREIKARGPWLLDEDTFEEAVRAYGCVNAFGEALDLIDARLLESRGLPKDCWFLRTQYALIRALEMEGSDEAFDKAVAVARDAVSRLEIFAKFNADPNILADLVDCQRRLFVLLDDDEERLALLEGQVETAELARVLFEGRPEDARSPREGERIGRGALYAHVLADSLHACGRRSDGGALKQLELEYYYWELFQLVERCERWAELPGIYAKLDVIGTLVSADYSADASRVAIECRNVLPITAHAGKRAWLCSYVRSWQELAGFLARTILPTADTGPSQIEHWSNLHRALSESELPGIVAIEFPAEEPGTTQESASEQEQEQEQQQAPPTESEQAQAEPPKAPKTDEIKSQPA